MIGAGRVNEGRDDVLVHQFGAKGSKGMPSRADARNGPLSNRVIAGETGTIVEVTGLVRDNLTGIFPQRSGTLLKFGPGLLANPSSSVATDTVDFGSLVVHARYYSLSEVNVNANLL